MTFVSCSQEAELTVFKAEAESEFGKKVIKSELIGTVHTESSVEVATGVRESYMDFLSMRGYVTKIYAYEIDLSVSDIDVVVSTAENYNSTAYKKQELTEQARLIDAPGNIILGGINGDGFNATGRPKGILIKNGTAIKTPATNPSASYFAITNDKKAVIGNEADLKTAGTAHLRDAIGGEDWLVLDGATMPQQVPTEDAKTAIGVAGDSKVILFVADGGNFWYSHGMTLTDVAKVMQALGAEKSIALACGKYSTFIARRDDRIILRNMPIQSTNKVIEEPVSNGIVIVKK
ncbi:hypothetical protein FACS189413_13110 [Bacteroidia bacterium]|nr:hypothetical protein FACS189413_13110 [Bacteroidia bacterium]